MQIDKKHWYDGWFYDRLIAPNQDTMFKLISSLIEENSSVIDIGCGTGRLEFQLASKCKSITGVDLSKKNIKTALNHLTQSDFKNIKFIQGNALDVIKNNERFDYAVITYVIHEIPVSERNDLLNTIREFANKIIIGDYLVPRTKGFWNLLNEAVEFTAGKDHYKNFKLFVNNGGLASLIVKNKFDIVKEVKNRPLTSHIIMIK
jgi:SAM-dependent methyltransferase